MKIWSSEHVFEHSWETVVKAALQKYPNPLSPNVTGVDVVERRIVDGHKLKSHRLFQTQWQVPGWISRVLGGNKVCFGSEHSTIDARERTLTLKSRNLTFSNMLSIDERLVYRPHPDNPRGKTQLTQEAVITVQQMPLVDYMESLLCNTINANAHKGRQAIEFVIERMQQGSTLPQLQP